MATIEPTAFLAPVPEKSTRHGDVTNQRFERLFVVRTYRKDGKIRADCLCDCQPDVLITRRVSDLLRGTTRSCGCLRKESNRAKGKVKVGNRFERLVVLDISYTNGQGYADCLCDCGNFATVQASKLVNRHTRSCGCLIKDIAHAKRKVNPGDRFTRLRVVEVFPGTHTAYADCVCDCGETSRVSTNHLLRGHTTSCGCAKKDALRRANPMKDLSDQRFGRLLVLRMYSMGQQVYAECLCDCGNSHTCKSNNLITKHTHSCGRCDGPRVRSELSTRLYGSRRQARKRGLAATFTPSQQTFMYQYWGYACAVCGCQEGFEWILAEDHWIPISSPLCPGTVAENMLPLCHGKGRCNNVKNRQDPVVWLTKKLGARKAKAKLKAIESFFAHARSHAEREMICQSA